MAIFGVSESRGMLVQSDMEADPQSRDLVHQALLYVSVDDFAESTAPFVLAGMEAGEPVLVRVGRDNAAALRAALGDAADDADLGASESFFDTPSRTRQKLLDWVAENGEGTHRVRVLSESPWPLESAAAVREWERHEAVTNVAFEGLAVSFVCAYDMRSLPSEIVEAAAATHPVIVRSGGAGESPTYSDPDEFCDWINARTPVRGDRPMLQMPFDLDNLAAVRRLAESEGAAAGLSGDHLFDHVLAVDEVATNAVLHGGPPAHLKLWREPGELIWEVSDGGAGIGDPLAGQLPPNPLELSGRGLWMARMTCDSLEFRSDSSGTVVSLHVALPA